MKHLRFASFLFLLACAGDAAAQINERDRLERCANNRARIAALEASRPAGAAGWSDEQISRARTALRTLEKQQWEAHRLASLASNKGDPHYQQALAVIQQMTQSARTFDILCYPYSDQCGFVVTMELGKKIQAAEAARPQLAALQQEMERHRTNLVALGCDQVAGGRSDAGSASAAQWMTGTFDSSFDVLTLSPGGGSYAYQGGQVQVSGIQGNVMEGIWTQTRSGRQCPDGRYYGRFRFTFTAGGFSGSYGYCDEEPGAGAWTGTRR